MPQTLPQSGIPYKRRERCLPLAFRSEEHIYPAAEAYGTRGGGPVTLARTTKLDKPIEFASTGGHVHLRHPSDLFMFIIPV